MCASAYPLRLIRSIVPREHCQESKSILVLAYFSAISSSVIRTPKVEYSPDFLSCELAGQLAQAGKCQNDRMHESPAMEEDHDQSQVPAAEGGRCRPVLLHRGSLGPCQRSFGLPATERHHFGHP